MILTLFLKSPGFLWLWKKDFLEAISTPCFMNELDNSDYKGSDVKIWTKPLWFIKLMFVNWKVWSDDTTRNWFCSGVFLFGVFKTINNYYKLLLPFAEYLLLYVPFNVIFDSDGCGSSHWCFFLLFFSYTSRVVSSGLKAQINNPELKVRGLDPLISNLIDKLQHFNQVSNF